MSLSALFLTHDSGSIVKIAMFILQIGKLRFKDVKCVIGLDNFNFQVKEYSAIYVYYPSTT